MRTLLLVASLLTGLAYANEDQPVPPAGSELLRVMLQGESAEAMKRLVAERGGELTHDLHIINAVGAIVTRAQLESILATGQVSRHIDDLSLIPKDDQKPEEEDDCKVAGSLEVQTEGKRISWKLFNKRGEPAALSRLTMAWPEQLGYLERLELDGAKLTDKVENSSLDLTPEEGAAVSGDTAQLIAEFSQPVAGVAQREFSLVAHFGEDCETELIPGYENSAENSYYPTAAGADILHLNGVTGKGVTVAVLDSGLWEHDALRLNTQGQNRVIARYDAIADLEGEEVFDESGHGTHMTSVMAHSEPVTEGGKPLGWYKGIAPDINVVAVKAFNEEGKGDFLDIVRGIQYIMEHREKHNIRILNLSFAARPRWPYWDDPINQAIMLAWHAGIVAVAAAGNEGPAPMTIGSPGNLPYIITVGAVTDSWTLHTRDDDYIPEFSSQGPTPTAHIKPDIVAPGGHISGITRPDSTLTHRHPEYMLSSGDFVMTGTSQAAALVSGMVALLLQLEPELSPNDVKCMLTTSAEPAINADGLLAYSPFQQGQGYVTASRVVTLGKRDCDLPGMDLMKDLRGEDRYQGPALINNEQDVTLPGLEQMLSPEPATRGLSTTRKWGVKDHLERTDLPQTGDAHPFNWDALYQKERAAIEALSSPAPE